MAQDAAGAFEHVAQGITSKKGNAVVEKSVRILQHGARILRWVRQVGDMVLGLVGSMVGAEGVIEDSCR